MKTNKSIILLAAILLLNGCSLRDNGPDQPGQDNVQNGTDESNVQNGTDESNVQSGTAETGSAGIGDAVDYEALYMPVIDDFYRLAIGEYDENNIPAGGTALLEGNGWNNDNAMLWDAGYMIRDLSGDGIPELLIGSTAGEEYEIAAGTMIYALFTAANGQPYLSLEGFTRNAYCILTDGSIFNQGSAGAAYRIFGLYDLTADGTALTCRDFWFTHEKDGNFEDIRCWHNTTGEWNPDVSEELPLTIDEFWAKEEEFAKQRKVLDLITFAEYGGVEKPEYAENPTVSAVYGNDYTGESDAFIADDTDYACDVVFTTDGTVRNFKIIALTLNEISDDGYVSFFFEDLYIHGDLTPEKGLAVKMNLPETIPFYGISYIDGTGAERVFSVNLSGFDGSVQLAEIGGVG